MERRPLTQTPKQIIKLRLHPPLLRETQNRILRPTPRLRPLHPIRTELDDARGGPRTEGGVLHAAAELRAGVEEEEVGEAALVEGAGGDYAGDAAAEDEDAGG